MIRLVNYIKSLIDVDDNDLNLILSNFNKKELSKGSFILQYGQVASSYYFIASGAVRIFSDKEPNDKTLWIAFENEFIGRTTQYKISSPIKFQFSSH